MKLQLNRLYYFEVKDSSDDGDDYRGLFLNLDDYDYTTVGFLKSGEIFTVLDFDFDYGKKSTEAYRVLSGNGIIGWLIAPSDWFKDFCRAV